VRTGPTAGRDDLRRRSVRRTVLNVAWLLATALGLFVATTTKIGPVLLSLSSNHGVHLGDVMAFAVAYAGVLVLELGWPRPR